MVEKTFREFNDALKPGGILAVEQHRANPGPQEPKPASGYVTERTSSSRRRRRASSSRRDPRSTRIPRIPRTTRSASGPCRLRCGLRRRIPTSRTIPNFDHSKYLAIGESDRMTLRFVKP